jgi:hypothetical protein
MERGYPHVEEESPRERDVVLIACEGDRLFYRRDMRWLFAVDLEEFFQLTADRPLGLLDAERAHHLPALCERLHVVDVFLVLERGIYVEIWIVLVVSLDGLLTLEEQRDVGLAVLHGVAGVDDICPASFRHGILWRGSV